MPKEKHQFSQALLSALNFQLVETDPENINDEARYEPPEWLPMCPLGVFSGRDGRTYNNKDSQAIIDWVVANKKDIQWDIEHASQLKAPQGEKAPAYGWTKAQASEFKIENNHLMARIEWNRSGDWVLKDKQLRYYSPVFIVIHKKTTKVMDIVGITSVGLTNNPNLFVPALNSINHPQPEENSMDFTALRASLGLEPSTEQEPAANMQECIAAANQLRADHATALNNNQPDMQQFALRTELNAAITRAETAETALAEQATEALQASIEAELNQAQAAGKITPATREFYADMCQQEGGLEKFQAFVKTAPVVVAGETDLNSRSPETSSSVLTEAEKEVCRLTGKTEAQFIEAKQLEESH